MGVKVEPLYALYCHDCADSLVRFRLGYGSIIPMCKECLHRFLANGDYERANKLVAEHLKRKPQAGK